MLEVIRYGGTDNIDGHQKINYGDDDDNDGSGVMTGRDDCCDTRDDFDDCF